jgi:hypothetical protein
MPIANAHRQFDEDRRGLWRGARSVVVGAVVVAAAAGGCDGCARKRAPRAQADAAAGPMIATGADAGSAGSGGGSASAEASRVFFLRFDANLLPFGCYDARTRALRPGKGCLELVRGSPRVGVVQLERGRAQPRALAAKPARIKFILSEETFDGLRLDLPCAQDEHPHGGPRTPLCEGPEGAAGAYAIWPESFKGLTLAPRSAASGATETLPPEVVSHLGSYLRQNGVTSVLPLALHQRLTLDLDGDAERETLLTVRVSVPGELHQEEELPSEWFFVYVSARGRFEHAHVPLARYRTFTDAEVLGYLDLDGDGAMELWLQLPYSEGHDTLLARWRSGAWEVIAEFGYGA